MPTFGENLRREREMRAVTLEEIAESTKISTRLLKALESDQFSELPGGVFTRSFIRAYAQYLGLDEEHVLAEYKRAAGAPSDNDLTRLVPNKSVRSLAGPQARLLSWVLIAILLGSGYAVYRYAHRTVEIKPAEIPSSAATDTSGSPDSSRPVPGGPQSSAPAGANPSSQSGTGSAARGATTPDAPGSQPSSGMPSGADSTSGGAPKATAAPASPVLGEGDLVLQVSTTEDAWMAVAADGKTLLQHRLPANSVRIFRAKESFDVTTANAQATVLALNGETQKPLGREGEFQKVHLTRNNLRAQNP